MEGIALVVTSEWKKDNKIDINGNLPMLLACVAGVMPSRSIINGTVALNMGLDANKTYLIQYKEGESDAEYGRQFNFTNLGQVSVLEILSAKK